MRKIYLLRRMGTRMVPDDGSTRIIFRSVVAFMSIAFPNCGPLPRYPCTAITTAHFAVAEQASGVIMWTLMCPQVISVAIAFEGTPSRSDFTGLVHLIRNSNSFHQKYRQQIHHLSLKTNIIRNASKVCNRV